MRFFLSTMVLVFAGSTITGYSIDDSRSPTASQSNVDSRLRSAFLGTDSWSDARLSPLTIKLQLQRHFATVIDILERQTDSSLDQAVSALEHRLGPFSDAELKQQKQLLAARRAIQIRMLQQYAERGIFPVNQGQSDQPIPIFVDHHDTHCAVGYLMHRSGWVDAVDEIRNNKNFIYVTDVKSGALLDWIIQSGLTHSEAAMIQPNYPIPDPMATLEDFADKSFNLVHEGLTISDLSVLRYSYLSDSDDFEVNFERGMNEIDDFGQPYLPVAKTDRFGLSMGSECYYYIEGPVPFDKSHWLFWGASALSQDGYFARTLGNLETGDDCLMFKIRYKAKSVVPIQAMAMSSWAFFNTDTVPFQTARIVTQILDVDSNLIAEGIYHHDGVSDIGDLNFSLSIPGVENDEIWVTAYLCYCDEVDCGWICRYSSLWHSFDITPPGDLNYDGKVDLLDVPEFVSLILNSEYECPADLNDDEVENSLDIVAFVEILLGG